MTAIAFHINVPDRLDYACRLLRKVVGNGASAIVTAWPRMLQQFDQLLWTFSPTDFIPHCLFNAGKSQLSASPIILATSIESVPHHAVLLNLGEQVPQGFERFKQVIELVTSDEQDRKTARGRWKQYSDAGHTMKLHDLALQVPK